MHDTATHDRSEPAWTRLSFFYLIGYLTLGGLGLVISPPDALRLLGAAATYDPAPMRLLGAFLLGIALIVVQITRHRAAFLYPTVLHVRALFVAMLVWLFATSRDPLFLVLAAIVGLGMILTGLGLLADRRGAALR